MNVAGALPAGGDLAEPRKTVAILGLFSHHTPSQTFIDPAGAKIQVIDSAGKYQKRKALTGLTIGF
jgi:hypothetical protein